MADRRGDGRTANEGRSVWLWAAAAAAAILVGAAYYFASIGTQPSVVSDEGGELLAPAEVEADALDAPVGPTGGAAPEPVPLD